MFRIKCLVIVMIALQKKNSSLVCRFHKKIVILGEGGVGKTTLLRRFMYGVFDDKQDITIGADFFSKILNIGGYDVQIEGKFVVWDLSGQERFRFLMQKYIQGAEAIILSYDMSRLITLTKLKNWIEILKESGVPLNGDVPIVLVGAKKDKFVCSDLELRKQYIEEIRKMIHVANYIETSSFTGENVDETFDSLFNLLVVKELKKMK